jgi:hypothetical protein
MNALSKHKLWLGLILAAALVMVPCGAVFAAQDDDKEAPPPTAKVTLDKKTTEVVITTIGDRYAVYERGTVIVGLEGQQVDYIDLPVPCDAVVTYRTEEGSQTALMIQITKISANAKKDFFQERPE